MVDTLILTADEKKVYDGLSGSLKEGWKVTEEEGTMYETAEELYVRATMARFDLHPDLQKFVENIRDGNFDADIPSDLSEDALQELCFTIGAKGVTVLMSLLLRRIQTDDDLTALASFSQIRHDILKTNADIRVPLS